MVATSQKRKRCSNDIYKLIRLYRANDCLWNPKSSSFRNLEMKQKAWQRISHLFNNGISVDEVKMQILSLRYYFATEMLAIKRCKMGGYPHVPKQPYFKELLFLKEAIEPSVSLKPIESDTQDRINCIVEDALLLSNSENSIHTEYLDFQIPSSNEFSFTNTELRSHESESSQLPLPQFDINAKQLPIRCQSGCDRWLQAFYYEDEDENYVRRASGSANANGHNQNYGYFSNPSVANSEYYNQNFNGQWAPAYAPQMQADYGNTLNTPLQRCACTGRKKVLTGRYGNKPKSTDVYYESEDYQRYVEKNAQRQQCRYSNGEVIYGRSYRDLSRHKSGDEQITPCNECVGINCPIDSTYPALNADEANQQNDYEVVCGYSPNDKQSDKANEPLADDDVAEIFEGRICKEGNCPNSQSYNQTNQSRRQTPIEATRELENNQPLNGVVQAHIKHRPCDDDRNYGNEQHCGNIPEMKDLDCDPSGKCKIGRHNMSTTESAAGSARPTTTNPPLYRYAKKKYCTNDRDRLSIINNENVIPCPFTIQPLAEKYDSGRPMQQTDGQDFEVRSGRSSQRRSRDQENTSTPKRQSVNTSRDREENNSGRQSRSPKTDLWNSAQQQNTYSMETVPEDTQQRLLDTLSNNSRGNSLFNDKRKPSELEYDRKPESKAMSGEEYEPNSSQRQRQKKCTCSNCQSNKSCRNNPNYAAYRVSNTQRDYYERDAKYERVNGRRRQEDYREMCEYNRYIPERMQTGSRNVSRRSDDNNRARAPMTENYRDTIPEYYTDIQSGSRNAGRSSGDSRSRAPISENYRDTMPEYNSSMQPGSRIVGRRSDDNNRIRAPMTENYRDNVPEYSTDMSERLQTGSRNVGRRSDSYNRNSNTDPLIRYRSLSQENGGKINICCYGGKYDREYPSSKYHNDKNDYDEYNECVTQCLPKKYQNTDYNRNSELEHRSQKVNNRISNYEETENIPTGQENIRRNDDSIQKYQTAENDNEIRTDKSTGCHSECPVRLESSRLQDCNSGKYQSEELDFENQQVTQANQYATRQEGSSYQEFSRNSRKYQSEDNIRADQYEACEADCPANKYQRDFGKTYENYNQKNDLLPADDQSTVKEITDDVNMTRYSDCMSEKYKTQQENMENFLEEMLDCECPTEEDDLQKLKVDQLPQAAVPKANIVCQCEAAVETDLDMSLKDRNNPQRRSDCQCAETAINAAVVPQNGNEEKSDKLNYGNPPNVKPRPPKTNRRKICSCKPPTLYTKKSSKPVNGVTKADTPKQRATSPTGTRPRSSSKRQSRVEDDNLNKFQGHGGQRCNHIYGIHNGGKNVSLGVEEIGYSIREKTVVPQPCEGMSIIWSFEVPSILAEKTIDILSNHIACKTPLKIDVKATGSSKSLPGENTAKTCGSQCCGTKTSKLGCRYRSNPFLKLNYEASKGNIIVLHPPAQGFRPSKYSISMKDCNIDNNQAPKSSKFTSPLSDR